MEAKDYPIFSILYHPEFKLSPISDPSTRETTDEMAYSFSHLLNRWACKNTNRVKDKYFDFLTTGMAVDRVPSVLMKGKYTLAYFYKHTTKLIKYQYNNWLSKQ